MLTGRSGGGTKRVTGDGGQVSARPDVRRGLVWVTVASLGVGLVGVTCPPGVAVPLLVFYAVGMGVWLWRLARGRWGRLSAWHDALPAHLVVLDRDLRVLDANRLFIEDFGECRGRLCHEVIRRRSTPCPDCPALEALAQGETRAKEQTVTTLSGETREVVMTAAPLRDARGRVEGVIEMSVDVTEAARLRRELERSKAHFQQLFDSVPCYITVQDRSFRIIESNDWFRRDFGDAVGRHCHEVYKGRDRICDGCPVERTLADGEVHFSEETVTTGGGEEISLIVYSMPIRDEDGEISAVMEVATNITEVKQLQRRLAMVGLAVSEMAHRIKNILMGLEGGIYVVNTGLESGDQALVDEGWKMVERNVERVSRITRDLLRASKDRTPRPEPDVCPAEIARDVYALFVQRAAADRIELELDVDAEPFFGNFDPSGLHNLLSNLVSNAIDACRFDPQAEAKRHRVRIGCHRAEPDGVLFEVSDNGAGMPEETSERIFERFFSTKGLHGTGLGLLVVQQIVEEHRGKIHISTEEGKGTTFRIVLPSQSLPAVAEGEEPDEPRA